MKKKLLVCMMALVLGLTGCSGGSGNSDNSSGDGNASKETKEERDYYGNKYREEYDVAYWTYIGATCKYLIDDKGLIYFNFSDGKSGVTPVKSRIIFGGLQRDDGDILDIDFDKEYTEEEMVQVGMSFMRLYRNKYYETIGRYSHEIMEFECDDVETIKVGDYEFVQGCGQIVIPPTESGLEDGLEPIRMDTVCYTRKMEDGNYFICYQFADTHLNEYGKEPVSIDEMKDYAKELLKTYKEYECEYTDFDEGV